MAVATYALDQYARDLRRITAETQDNGVIMDHVRPLSQRLALDRSWLEFTGRLEFDPEKNTAEPVTRNARRAG